MVLLGVLYRGRGFQCLYAPTVPECNGAPLGLYYDEEWHGVASREGFSDIGCRNADFGNACYNDHHYHFSCLESQHLLCFFGGVEPTNGSVCAV